MIGMIVCIGAATTVFITILNLINMGFDLTSGPFLLLVLADAALVAVPIIIIGLGKTDRNFVLRVVCMALAGLMFFLNIFISSYLSITNDFLDDQFFTYKQKGTVQYSIVAQRSATVELDKGRSVRAGIQSTDNNKTEAEQETKRLAAASFTEFENLSEMIGATEDEAVDIAVVQSALLDSYKEVFPDSYENLDVLTTFMAGTKASQASESVTVDITKPFAIYVSGSDVFGDINQVARSDVNILVLIDPEHYKMMLINTPRDYYVQLHGTSGYKDKLTHAGLMGVDVSEATMEDLYGLEIDYHVRMNFDTLVNLVDAMGGIVVDNPVAFSIWGNSYGEGEIYLTGDYALMYVRARKGLAHGDYDRGENQQRVIEALVARITSPTVVTHYVDIINALGGTFSSNIPKKAITQLFSRQITLGGDWSIEKMSASGFDDKRPTYSMGDLPLDVVIPDESSLEDIRAAIRDFMLDPS